MGDTGDAGSRSWYFGTKRDLKPGDLIEPDASLESGDTGGGRRLVHLTDRLDAASWQGETAPGDGPGRIYLVEPTGPIMDTPGSTEAVPPVAVLSFRSRDPLRVMREITDAQGHPPRLYHGTKADLAPGDLIEPGHSANFGAEDRMANFVYLTGTLDAAVWGAELARGDGPGRIYVVEPTGPVMEDPNLTNTRFPGNPTKSYRSREPLRVTEEVMNWQGHPPEIVQAMREGLSQLDASGAGVIDD